MTDRIKGFVVTLDRDYREDDVESIRNALLMIKGVLSVDSSVADVVDHMNRERILREVSQKLIQVVLDQRKADR